MKKFFEGEITIKIFSVVIAIVLWAYVMGLQDPYTDTYVRGFTVSLNAEDSLPIKLGYSIIKGADTKVDIQIRGKRSDLARLSENDITVKADINSLTRAGEFTVPIDVQIANENITVLQKVPSRLNLRLDKMRPWTVPVKPRVDGATAGGFMIGDVTVEPSTVTLTGPVTDIDFVSSALATVKAEGMNKTFATDADLELIDKNGDKVIEEYITKDAGSAKVTTTVLKQKQLPVKVNLIEDIHLDMSKVSVQYSTAQIAVAGEAGVIDKLESISLGDVYTSEIAGGISKTFEVSLPRASATWTAFPRSP